MTESVIRRYTLTELTAWIDMPMPERYGCIDIDERRVISDIERVVRGTGTWGMQDKFKFYQKNLEDSRWDRYLGMMTAMTQVPVD